MEGLMKYFVVNNGCDKITYLKFSQEYLIYKKNVLWGMLIESIQSE